MKHRVPFYDLNYSDEDDSDDDNFDMHSLSNQRGLMWGNQLLEIILVELYIWNEFHKCFMLVIFCILFNFMNAIQNKINVDLQNPTDYLALKCN